METPNSTGTATEPEPIKPWKQVAEESNIFSLPAEQRVAEYDKWSQRAIAKGIRDGDFDSRDTFSQFKLLDIRTRKNLASDDIVGPSDEDILADYNSFSTAFQNTQQAFSSQKPTPEDNAIQGEVLQGKRNAAFVRGQMVFNPTIVNDPQKYREAILESDAPPDIKMFYAGLRPEMEKSATVTRRRELANSVITRDVADKVVNAIQEGTEVFGADIGTPQSPALKKNKAGVWSVVDPEYSDKETSFLGRANAKYNPLADSLYKPIAEINEYQKKYGLSDEQVQQDYMEALIENAPTAVNRWVSKATSVEEYVKQLDSTVRVKNKDVAPEVRVQDPNLFFDEEGYNAAVDKANAPDEAKNLAKEARTQFADAVAGDIYNNLLANRDDFREDYAKDVVKREDMAKAITRYYKDKKDQAWYDDVGEFIGQTVTALEQGGMNVIMTPSAILGMFGSVKDAEDVRYATMVQNGQMQAEEAVANRTGGAGAIKLTGDVARILPDLAVQMVIGIMSGGALSFSQAAAFSARTGLSRAAARTAIRQAAITGEKAALKTELAKLIPNLSAQAADDVATGALEVAARTMSNNPLKGGIGTQRAIGSAYAGLTSAGSTFGQVYTEVRAMGKSPEESIGIARTAGITAGAITGALTHTFGVLGRGGVEDFASMGRKAGEFTIRDIVKSGVRDVLTTQEGRQLARSIATGIAKDALHEGVEEGLDQALNLISQYATNPSPEAQNRKVSDVINESLYATLLGGIAGGGSNVVGQARVTAPGITAQQMQAEILGADATVAPSVAPPENVAPSVTPAPEPIPSPAPVVQSDDPVVQQVAETAKAIADVPDTSQTAAALAGLANAAAAPIIPPPSNLPVVPGQQQPFQQPAQSPTQPKAAPTPDATVAPVAPTTLTDAANADGVTVTEPQQSGVRIVNIDDLVNNGGGVIQVSKNGREVKFKQFSFAIDGNSAEITFVELDPSERGSGVGKDAYISLGEELAKRGITLQSSKSQYGNGRNVWLKLAADGRAKRGAQGIFYFVSQQIRPTTSESEPAAVKPTAEQPTEEMKTTEETPTARDTTKPEQMTPEKGDEVFVKGGDDRITRRIDNIFTAEGKQMVLLQGLQDPIPLDEVVVDPKSDYRKRKQRKAEQTARMVAANPQLIRQLGDLAVRDKQPVGQDYINAIGGGIPKGYVKEGELYVFKGEEAPAAEALVEKPVKAKQPKPTKPDAVQKPKPDEGVLRQERPEVGLPEVDQRGRGAEQESAKQAEEVKADPVGYGNALIGMFPALKVAGVKAITPEEAMASLDAEWKTKLDSGKATRLEQLFYNKNKSNIQELINGNSTLGGMWIKTNKTVVIGKTGKPSVMAHEIGHAIMELEYENAPKKTKDAIVDEYWNWFGEKYGQSGTPTVADQRRIWEWMTDEDWMNPSAPSRQRDSSWERYRSEFSEWFADEVAKWAATKEEPRSLIEKFFSELAAKLTRLWDAVRGNFSPSETLSSWLDSISQPSPAKVETAKQEQKPEVPPEQQDVVVFMDEQNDEIEERQKPKKKRITPGEARKAGIAKQIGKLGIQSNDPDSVIAALKKIAAKPPQPHHARIAKDLLSVLEGSGTSIVLVASNDLRIKKGDERVNGWYDPQTNAAYINLDGPHELGIEETILHELVHASGEKVIRNPQTDAQKRILGDLQKQMEAATKNAISLGQSVLKTKETDLEKLIALAASKNNYALFDILYGVSSLSEYHAHATTSKAFQRFLSEYKEGSKRNFFERFVNSITSLLSGKKTTEGSDAEKSYATLLDLMRENKGDVRLSNTDAVQSRARGVTTEMDAEYLELAKDPEKNADALQAIINKAADSSAYKEKGVRAGFYDKGVPLLPSRSGNLGAAYYAVLDGTVEDVIAFASSPRFNQLPENITRSTDLIRIDLGSKPITLSNANQAFDLIKQRGLVDEFASWLDLQETINSAYSKTGNKRPDTLEARRAGILVRQTVESKKQQRDGLLAQGYTEKDITALGLDKETIETPDSGKAASFLFDKGIATSIVVNWKGDISSDYRKFKEVAVANPEQIKSAALVTRDESGNIIPPSQRFNPASQDIRFSRARGVESDPAHAELERRFKAGGKDAEQEAKALVEETAKQAGWTEKAYHGTPGGGFTVFDIYGSRYGLMGQGAYFTDARDIARSYADKQKRNVNPSSQTPMVYEVFLKPGRVLDMEAPVDTQFWLDAFGDYLTEDSLSDAKTNENAFRALEEALKDEGVSMSEGSEIVSDGLMSRFDSVKHIGGKRMGGGENLHNVTIVFNSEQIKSADAFTYDDDGNLIPLSERFNAAIPDIRYSKARGIVSDAVVKFAPQFNVVDAPDGPSVEFDGRSVTVNPEKLANLEEYEVQDLANRAVVAAIATPKDPIAAGIIQQTMAVEAYNFDSESRKGIRKRLADAHRTAHEFGMSPLAMELGNRLFEFGGATDADVRKSRAKNVSFGQRATYDASSDTNRYSLPRGGELVGPTTFSIKAYHGTPHKVDKFSLERIGTGEGAQAYGWGLYFAEALGIAEWYRDSLTQKAVLDKALKNPRVVAARQVIATAEGVPEVTPTGPPSKGWGTLPSFTADEQKTADSRLGAITQARADYSRILDEVFAEEAKKTGNLYTVELLPNEEDFLDWDAPLSGDMVERIDAAVRKNGSADVIARWEDFSRRNTNDEGGMPGITGSAFYGIVASWVAPLPWEFSGNKNKQASEFLASGGIPGIRYLDGMSRKAGDGSRNYVIFDDKLIKILEENGMPVPQSRARGTELVTRVSGPALAMKKFISGFRSRGMVSQDAYDALRDSDAFKKENAAFVSFIAKDFTNVTNKLFGEGGANLENFRVFSRDVTTGEATVSSRGFETRQKAEAFAVTNRYKDYIVSTGQDLINQALGSNGPTLKEDVRDAIEKLTKKGLDDIAKSIEAYKEEYLNYWNLVVLETQADMIDEKQIATLRERKEQWMAALRLRSEEQKKLVDDARKKAVQAAIADAKNRIVQQQQFAKAYLPDELVHQIERAREKIDELSTRLTGINWLMEGSELQMVIEGLNGVYVTRSYEAFETSDKAAYVAWLNEAYNALTNRDQAYDPIAMERIMPLVRHIKNGIMERRIEDLKKENDQRQVDAIMEDLMADSRQVTQVDRVPGQPIEGTEYEQLIRAVAKRDLLRRRSDEKKQFVRDMMRHLDAAVGFGRNIGNRRKRAVALRKEANRIYNERYGDAEQQIIADMFGRPQGLQWAVMTDDEAHDIANAERALSESPGNLSGSAIWTSSINGNKHSTFNAAVNDDFKENLNFILKAPGAKTSVTTATANDWKRLGDKILEHKNDVPAFLRTFLGEKDNPLLRVSDTIMKQSHLVAVGNLYQNIADIGDKAGWLVSDELKDSDQKYNGWVPLLSSAKTDQGYENNPLKGMYADPMMAKAIETLLAANQPSNSAFKAISIAVGVSLWGVTAGSVRAIVRNLASLPIFLMNSGILGAILNPTRWPIVAKNVVLASRMVQQSMEATGKISGGKQINNKAFKLVDWAWTKLLSGAMVQRPALYAMKGAATIAEFASQMTEKPTAEESQEMYLNAVRLGVANDNVQKEAIHRLLDIEEQAIRKPKDKNMGRFAKALKLEGAVGFGSYLLGTTKTALQQRSQLYGAPDDFTKILAWLNEMDAQARINAKDDAQYNQWRGKNGLFSELPDDLVKKAADNVTNLIQSHSRVWAHITQFKKAGFGTLAAPFAAARAEFYRNAANAYIIAFEEMRSDNPKEQTNGKFRFASALMAHFVMGNAIGAVVKTIFSAFADDDEIVEGSPEYREAVRRLGPEYAKNKNATYILYKNGTFDWVDLSFADPFSFFWSSITAARRGATEKDVEDNIVVEMSKEVIAENIGTFAKPQIALDAYATVMSGYDSVRGVKIWDSQADSFGDKFVKSVSYYMKQAGLPGDYKDGMKIWKAANGVEENGRQYKVGTEVGAVFLGTSIRTVNITDALEQKLAQAKDTLGTRITPLYKAPLRNANDVEMEDVALAVQQYAKAHDQAVSTMQKSYKAAETLLRETPNAKTLLRNVMSSDRVRMSQEVERAIITGKPSFPGFSDQTLQKVKDLGKKHDDDRAKVMVDALKEYNQKKKNP